ncbi:tRNA glutamyl-Q synthetase [Corynebacterium sp. HMSC063A05]|uniref:tRNA glutamyl-Q(34) synthetase GluQRS n=3 Tax=Corynebacteriaceae TaxID=1653 RepID=UPI0006651C9B|nr:MULTISPECIES: tRNA glutamyl-Q(34) synthetase GluQRS [Corynebacterium]KAA9286780.1 tRNA glutamyl-Q(34) synthetase GluQRS [Corynebacterium amycolatum]MBC6758977.1 tRNA glutamyl-Q(34) synthetase GluQRS [Corynebacterium sp. LK24]MCT1718674.1 tRNA glutamyl-Q(34) synthetase GluQRS [Corynebacterium amycolatum]OFM84431.1 tRNA glutamyl-Q synthetase [Corynebacterium sp. HMSC063A05]OFN09042.1 tRNA glutamyl-Q synthetase [Corynebacterium sp. HMSC074C11]
MFGFALQPHQRPPTGRYAPSPTGRLHLGNLRTAVLAWAHARAQGGRFIVRIEDIDRQRSRPEYEAQQLADLEAIGIDWDGTPVRQSERSELYESALVDLTQRGLTYPCFCTRREILAASSAPHGVPGQYPGTCRSLDDEHLSAKKAEFAAAGRRPSLRLKSQVCEGTATDELHGEITAPIDDFVLQRADGMWAYNLAVVVDDAEQGVTEVVRGDDLMSSAPRQAYLAGLLGYATPSFVHVPLVVNSKGRRLSKRDGDVTLGEVPADAAQRWILGSLSGGGGNGSDGGDGSDGGAELDSIADLPEALRAGLEIPRGQVIF